MSWDRKNQNEKMKRKRFQYTQMDYLIGEYVTGFKAERNRKILREHFLDGYTHEEIAEHFGMSAVQIGRIIRNHGDPLLLMIGK